MNKLEIKVTDRDKKISQIGTDLTAEQVAIIKNTVAKGVTDTELAYFLNVCQSVGLNPFNKEIWCYRDKKRNLIVFAGRDGFLSKAQQNSLFNGIRSCEICLNDEWEINIPEGIIKHKITKIGEARGKILSAYAIVFRKDGEPTIEFVEFARYNKNEYTWKSHPEDMIKKVAETHALKKAFGISGIQSEYDWNVKNGIAEPIALPKDELTIKKEKIIEALSNYQGEDKKDIQEMCIAKEKVGEFTDEFANHVYETLNLKFE